jgi:predicted RNase H-like HicB family nuclease
MRNKFTIRFTPEKIGFSAFLLEEPGVVTQGRTRNEARARMREAIQAWYALEAPFAGELPAAKGRRRKLAVAQHEAAHAVVACALKVPVKRVTAKRKGDMAGYTLFNESDSESLAFGIILAAGSAGETLAKSRFRGDSGDRQILRDLGYKRGDWATLKRLATMCLRRHEGAWHAVTEALRDRDLTGAELLEIWELRK